MSPFTFFLGKIATLPLAPEIRSTAGTLTACNSHVDPSAMYLKHHSQTHKIDFSPVSCERETLPDNRSEVRAYGRLLTAGVLGVGVDDLPWEGLFSSASDSVNGYGEKYLRETSVCGLLSRGNGHIPSFDLPPPKVDLVKVSLRSVLFIVLNVKIVLGHGVL